MRERGREREIQRERPRQRDRERQRQGQTDRQRISLPLQTFSILFSSIQFNSKTLLSIKHYIKWKVLLSAHML